MLQHNKHIREDSYELDKLEDKHHQACAVVERLLSIEESTPDTPMGGVDTQNDRKRKIIDTADPITC